MMARKYVPIETKRETGRIYLDEIIYIEKNLRKTILITDSRKVTIYCGMNAIKQHMDGRFLNCHRSYLFNMDRINRMAGQTIYMDKGYRVTLGRDCFRQGRKLYRDYLCKKKSTKNI